MALYLLFLLGKTHRPLGSSKPGKVSYSLTFFPIPLLLPLGTNLTLLFSLSSPFSSLSGFWGLSRILVVHFSTCRLFLYFRWVPPLRQSSDTSGGFPRAFPFPLCRVNFSRRLLRAVPSCPLVSGFSPCGLSLPRFIAGACSGLCTHVLEISPSGTPVRVTVLVRRPREKGFTFTRPFARDRGHLVADLTLGATNP